MGLLVDDKVVSLDDVVGVELLVGELHLLGPGNLGHLLVVVPQSHVRRGQAEVALQSLLELLDRLADRDLLLPALVFEVDADLDVHIRTEVDVDERIQNPVNLHQLLPSGRSLLLLSVEEISDESPL